MKLFEHLILMGSLRRFFVECHDVGNHLGVFPTSILWDAAFIYETLPFFR